MKKIVALLLLLATVVSAQQTAGTTTTPVLTPGEVYSTGNLVQMTTTTSGSTWTNAVYQDQLTCWAWGMPGNCGPNPSVRPGNIINYSYGLTDIYQQVQLANSATLAVPGLRINGYNFGFMAKNGNGWDDGRVDQLNAYVTFYGSDGKVKDYTNYNLNSKFDWTQFNYTKDFVSPYSITELSTVRYGFVGMDNNFWAGNYGPEIYNISFSLKYSVDPCANDPLYSPTCPGYMDALNKLLPPAPVSSTTTVDPVVSTVASPTTIVTEPVAVQTTTPTTTTTVGQPTVVAAVVAAPAPAPVTTTPTTSSTTSTTSSSTVQVTKESTPSSGGNVSLALSIISKNQDRDAAGSAVAQAAVAQAQQTATQAQQEAVSVAAQAVSNSISAGQSALKSESNNSSTRTGSGYNAQSDAILQNAGQVSLVLGPTVNSNSNSNTQKQEQATNTVAMVNVTQTNNVFQTVQSVLVNKNEPNKSATVDTTPTTTSTTLLAPQQNQTVTATSLPNQSINNSSATISQEEKPQSNSIYALVPPQQHTLQLSMPIVTTVEISQQPVIVYQQPQTNNVNESPTLLPPNFLTDRTNPLTDIVEAKQNIPQSSTIVTTGPSVNRNAQDSEVAGGVSISKMATAPQGYGDYLNFTMRDVAFYAPKEVYKNQRNVDNQRALRLLTNDSKHREMVEMQYAK